jgi:catechol 2,3-dioxygenase-like lactoylglutathione lyase family enzyme
METTMPPPPPVLDHVVIDVRNRIDEAMHSFSALGFQLTPRGHHTLGSVNHLAMFATDYLELLGFGELGATRTEIARFPVGLNGLVFKTADADLVHRRADASGLPVLPVQAFSRPVDLDGATRDARFRTTRLDPDKIAIGRVYFCEHLTPDLVWRPEWQSHPNSASAISRVVVATADPQRSALLFHDLFGAASVAEHAGKHVMAAGAAQVELVSPNTIAAEFGEAAPEPAGRAEYMAVLGIRVRSLRAAAQRLRSIAGVRGEEQRLVVPAAAAFNTTIVLSE